MPTKRRELQKIKHFPHGLCHKKERISGQTSAGRAIMGNTRFYLLYFEIPARFEQPECGSPETKNTRAPALHVLNEERDYLIKRKGGCAWMKAERTCAAYTPRPW